MLLPDIMKESNGACACRLLQDDMKESGLLSVLARLMRMFNARVHPRWHAVDIMQVQCICLQAAASSSCGMCAGAVLAGWKLDCWLFKWLAETPVCLAE